MATIGRKKRKRKIGARTGVAVKPHSRSPRGGNAIGGKKKRAVHVDPYQRGKPTKNSKSARAGKKRRRKR